MEITTYTKIDKNVSETMKQAAEITQDYVKELQTLQGKNDVDGLYNFMDENALDFSFTIGRQRDLKGVEILVGFGGPNIYIDTNDGRISSYWGNETVSCYLPDDVCSFIDEYWGQEMLQGLFY